jgi:hypothetical protein
MGQLLSYSPMHFVDAIYFEAHSAAQFLTKNNYLKVKIPYLFHYYWFSFGF